LFPIFEERQEDLSVSTFGDLVFPEHLHDHVELIFLGSGNKRLHIGGREVRLFPGDLAVVFPNVVHSYLQQEGFKQESFKHDGSKQDNSTQDGANQGQAEQDESCSGTLLICAPSILSEFQAKLRTQVPQSPVLRAALLHEDVGLCLARLAGEESMAVKKAFLHLLLCRVMPALQLQKLENNGEADILTRAIRYISQNYQRPLTLQGVARALGVNTYYLSHVFSARMHLSHRRYLNSLRIALARRLLESTDTPITQVCFECGFENLRTFDRVFLSHAGVTPRAYRKQQG
jgi:AraC-like DNA-binding protein